MKARLFLQHRFNPLHVYCRLVDARIGKARAIVLCRLYGMIYRYAYWT